MEIKPNNLYLGDCYEIIKKIPDKSIDLVYTDIPYSFVGNGLNGGGGCFGTKKRDYHKEYEKVSVNEMASGLAKRKSSSSSLQDIAYGVDHLHNAYNKASFKSNNKAGGGTFPKIRTDKFWGFP